MNNDTRDNTPVAEAVSADTNSSTSQQTHAGNNGEGDTDALSATNNAMSINTNNNEDNDNDTNDVNNNSNTELEYDVFDPESIRSEIQRRKVPGKLIDKFWEPLDPITDKDFDKILDISINKATERYRKTSNGGGRSVVSEKLIESEDLLSRTWASHEHPESFRARLKATKLPLKRSMHNSAPQNDENTHILNYDILKRRKNFLETHLSAELKQLHELEKSYNKIKSNYDSDLKYLNEFKKSIDTNKLRMSHITNERRHGLKIPATTSKKKLNFKIIEDSSVNFKFEENEDEDEKQLKEVLHKINNNLEKLTQNSKPLLEFNEKLRRFQGDLDLK